MAELNGLFLVILTELSAECKLENKNKSLLDSNYAVILQSVMVTR